MWTRLTTRSALAGQSPLEIEAGRFALLLYDIGGTVYATAAICPHHAAWLSQGHIEGEHVNCPRHLGQFHIPSGRQTRGPPCPALRTYTIEVRGDAIWADLG